MFVFKILPPDVKPFMNKLLREEAFDAFEVRGVEIAALTRFQISGALDPDFAEGDVSPDRRFCIWRELKAHVFDIVRGGKRPKHMKITLSLPPEQAAMLHENASACFLNISFEGEEVLCTTGTSEKSFTMDKTLDATWDDSVKAFVAKHGIVINTQLE